jgi:hypothetical protein
MVKNGSSSLPMFACQGLLAPVSPIIPHSRPGCSQGCDRSELGDAVHVAVWVREPGHSVIAQLRNPVLVRLDPITVHLHKADAAGRELVHRLLEVIHLPGGDRAARLARV